MILPPATGTPSYHYGPVTVRHRALTGKSPSPGRRIHPADTRPRTVGGVADALHTPGVVDAKDGRIDDAGLLACQTSTLDVRTGVLHGPGTTALVTGTAATGTMTYAIAAHHWVASRGVANGPYRGALEAATTVATAPAPGSNSRIDVIWAKQQDTTAGIPSPDAATGELYGVTSGAAAVSPVKPAIPVGAVELATAVVAAGATSTNGAGVTITNTGRLTVARGAAVPVRSQAERDALAAAWGGSGGLTVKRLDATGTPMEEWDGTSWRRYRFAETPSWSNLALNAPFTATSEGARYTVHEGVCHFRVSATRTTVWSPPVSLWTFPAGVRPPHNDYPFTFTRSGSAIAAGFVLVDTDGTATFYDVGGAANDIYRVSGSFPVA